MPSKSELVKMTRRVIEVLLVVIPGLLTYGSSRANKHHHPPRCTTISSVLALNT
jgi:hypothetical protein